ncbi:MAG: PEP-CTERM sorting domain-containing protein [Verrucomicrobia bacterium]|nr:PEP-CTERM sorting domain-containing protein [Verrucomicrobiota bacterium]
MKKMLGLVILLSVVAGWKSRAAVVLTVPTTGHDSTLFAVNSTRFQVFTAAASPNWKLDSLDLNMFRSANFADGYDPRTSAFSLKVFDASGAQIGSDVAATTVSTPTGSGFINWSVGFNLSSANLIVLGNSSFSYSVVSSDPSKVALLLRSVNTDMGTGWRTGGGSTGSVTLSASAVPEPSSAALLIAGTIGLLALRRRRKKTD